MTDGWQAYQEACELVFGGDTRHIVTTPFKEKDLSTNIIERWHGTLRDRLKPMRGMDKSETHQLILEGFILNYNYLRPHESLKGRTPAEAAKVGFPYKSWLDIIKSQISKPNSVVTINEIQHPLKPYRKRPKRKNQSKRRKETRETRPIVKGMRL